MSEDHEWMNELGDEQITLATQFSTPYTCLRLSRLSDSSSELFENSPVLFWLLANYSLFHKWREKKFVLTVSRKRTEILGGICNCSVLPTRSALKFLDKFNGCKLKTDSDRDVITKWVRKDRLKRVNHYKSLSPDLLRLFDVFPKLVGAKWTHSVNTDDVDIQEYQTLFKDSLNMAKDMGILAKIENNLYNLKEISEIEGLHASLLPRYLEHLYATRDRELRDAYKIKTLKFPDPPLNGTSKITPITDSFMLYKEGMEQVNCVYGYLEEILAGHYYAYKVASGQRATLGVNVNPGRNIEIDQLLGAENTVVSTKMVALVNGWLKPGGIGSQSFVADYKQKQIDERMSAYMEYQNLINNSP